MRRLLLAGLLLLVPASALAQTQWGISIPAITNDLRLYEPTFTNYVGLHAPNSVTTYDCAMPGTIGTATQTLSISTVSPCALAWTSSGAGNVTHTGTLTANAFILGNGGADITALALTGLVLGNGASAPTAYAGTTPCSAGDFIRSLNGSGVATCATPAGGGNVNAGGTLTLHALVLGQGTTSVAVLGSLGTTTTVLHGNAAGDPSFAAVNLANDVTGTLAYASLPSQANNTILANISGGSAVPAADTLTAIIDSAIGSTQGNILYRNATVWTVLAPGTSGQFLQTQGAGANVQWSAAGGGTVTGTGTTNLLAIWTSASAIGAFSNGTGLLHAGTPPTWSLVNLSAGGDVVNVLTVPNGGLGLSSGTTGGIPYFTGGTTIASSAALTNHAVVIGGGAVQAPHTIATGTSGQFLESQGSGADPIWAALAASALSTSTFAGLPSASGAWGPVRLVTDNIRGLFMDTHNTSPAVDQWVGINRPCNVQLFGAKSDGTTNDATAIQAAITAGCQTVFLPKNTLWIPTITLPTGLSVVGEDSSVLICLNTACGASPPSTKLNVATKVALRTVTVQDSINTTGTFLPFYFNNTPRTQNIFSNFGVTADYLDSGQPNSDTSNHVVQMWGGGDAYFVQFLDPAWSSTTTYHAGDSVAFSGAYYQSLTTNTNSQPNTHPADWSALGGVNGAAGLRVDINTNNSNSRPIMINQGDNLSFGPFTWTGDVIHADMGTNSSIFSGLFLGFTNNLITEFTVDSLGDTFMRGGLEVGPATGGNLGTGNVNISGTYAVNNTLGLTVTKTVRAAGGASDCTLIFTGGILTGGTC